MKDFKQDLRPVPLNNMKIYLLTKVSSELCTWNSLSGK